MANKGDTQRGTQSECMLELAGGMACYGQLINLSPDTALVSTNAFIGGRRIPKVGDTGVITLNISSRGKREALKVSCRVSYTQSGQISLNLMTSAMTKYQQEVLKEVTQSGMS